MWPEIMPWGSWKLAAASPEQNPGALNEFNRVSFRKERWRRRFRSFSHSLRFSLLMVNPPKTSGTPLGPTTLAMPLHWAALWLVHATAAPLVTLIVSRHGIRDLEVKFRWASWKSWKSWTWKSCHFTFPRCQILRSSMSSARIWEWLCPNSGALRRTSHEKYCQLPEFMCGSTRAVRVRAFCFFWRNSSCGGALDSPGDMCRECWECLRQVCFMAAQSDLFLLIFGWVSMHREPQNPIVYVPFHLFTVYLISICFLEQTCI